MKKIFKKTNILISILLFFIVIFLPKFNIISVGGTYVGIRIEDLLISLSIILFIISNNIRDLFKNKNLKKICLIFLIYILICMFSTVLGLIRGSVTFKLAAMFLLRKIEYFIVIFIGYNLIKSNDKWENRIIKILNAAVIIHMILFILQYFGLVGTFIDGNYVYLTGGRIYSTFNGPYEISAFLILLEPLYIYKMINKKNLKNIIISIVYLLMLAICIYLTESRTSLVLFIFMLIFVPLNEFKNNIFDIFKVNKIKSIFISCIIIFMMIIGLKFVFSTNRFKSLHIDKIIDQTVESWNNRNFDNFKNQYYLPEKVEKTEPEKKIIEENNKKVETPKKSHDIFSRYKEAKKNKVEVLDKDLSYNYRITKWMDVLDYSLKSPIYGLGVSITHEAVDGNYIRIFAETGLIGIIVWIVLLITIFRLKYTSKLNKIVHYGIVILLFQAVFIDIFEASKIMMFYYFMLGCNLAFENTKNNDDYSNLPNKKKNKLAILLATYNGEKYLKEQIDSIMNQTYKDFTLFIRDDGSKDKTVEIIKKYTKKYDNIIHVVDKRESHGSCDNFLNLLKYAYELDKYDIFMFADQDDVWLPNKVEITVNEYKKHNDKIPQLLHTDLYVVDKNLKVMSKSFVKYSNLNSNCKTFNKYLIQNNVTGCTMLINKKLVGLVNFDIKDVRMHDWYFALLASAFGQVHFINESTIKYRQHDKNVLGAKKIKGIRGIYNKLLKNNTIKDDLSKIFVQAEIFKENYYDQLNDENKEILDSFCQINKVHKFKKLRLIKKYKFYKQGKIRVLGEITFI